MKQGHWWLPRNSIPPFGLLRFQLYGGHSEALTAMIEIVNLLKEALNYLYSHVYQHREYHYTELFFRSTITSSGVLIICFFL